MRASQPRVPWEKLSGRAAPGIGENPCRGAAPKLFSRTRTAGVDMRGALRVGSRDVRRLAEIRLRADVRPGPVALRSGGRADARGRGGGGERRVVAGDEARRGAAIRRARRLDLSGRRRREDRARASFAGPGLGAGGRTRIAPEVSRAAAFVSLAGRVGGRPIEVGCGAAFDLSRSRRPVRGESRPGRMMENKSAVPRARGGVR